MGGPIRVLHVDDEPDFASLTASHLERASDRLSVATETDAHDALDRLAEEPYDCVVSDYEMPRMDGIDLLSEVRNDHPGLPFLLFTGKGSEEVASEAISEGVTDYLQKKTAPSQYDVLANRIENAVAQYQAEQRATKTTRRLEAILENTTTPMFLKDAAGEYLLVNHGFRELFGFEDGEVVGRTDEELFPPEMVESVRANDRQVIESGESVETEERILVDGEERTYLSSKVPFRDVGGGDSEGGPVAVFGVAKDITERKARERELARFERAVEAAGHAIYMTEPDGTITYCNPAFEELTGYPREEAIGQTPEILSSGEHESGFFEDLWETVTAGDRWEGEVVDRRKDGELYTARQVVSPVTGPDGGIDRFVAVQTDLTERKVRERELQQAETLFQHAQDGLFLIDVGEEFTVQRVNPAYEESTGMATEAVVGRTPREILGEQEGGPIEERYRQCVRERSPLEYEETLTIDGERTYWQTRIAPVVVDGEVTQLVGATRNVTDRKERERDRERRYEAIFNGTYQFTGLMEPDGTLVEANETALDFAGLDPEDVLGKPFWEAHWWQIDEATQQELRAAVERAADGEFVRYDVDVQGEEEVRTIDFSIRPITDDDGEVAYLIPEGRDITELASLRNRERQLERQNERLAEFASIVSHDLRSPLSVAAGAVDLARRDTDHEQLRRAADALDRCETLIEDLLTLAREGETVEEPAPVEIAAVAESCWRTAVDGGATLDVPADCTIHADRGRLRQLLENLFSNAVEHGSTGSQNAERSGDTVEHGSTSLRQGGDAVEHGSGAGPGKPLVTVGELPDDDGFYVADDGVGIPPDDREQVFESGYTTVEDGTGFGLAIVAEIAEAHGWSVDLTESEGGGARFEISGVEVV